MSAARPGAVARLAMSCIRAYQWAFAWTPSRCRYWPTCSEYARQAIAEHGAVQGTWLGLRRIGRCHPWHPGGVDPVPHRASSATEGA